MDDFQRWRHAWLGQGPEALVAAAIDAGHIAEAACRASLVPITVMGMEETCCRRPLLVNITGVVWLFMALLSGVILLKIHGTSLD